MVQVDVGVNRAEFASQVEVQLTQRPRFAVQEEARQRIGAGQVLSARLVGEVGVESRLRSKPPAPLL
jgi:hypothetical protein